MMIKHGVVYKMLKKILLLISVLILTATLGIFSVGADAEETPPANRDLYNTYAVNGGTVTNIDELVSALSGDEVCAEKIGESTVRLKEHVILKAPIIIKSGSYIIEGGNLTIYRGSDYGALFLLNSTEAGAKPSLVLKGELTLDGMSDKYEADSGLIILFGSSSLSASGVDFIYSDSYGEMGGAISAKTSESSTDERTPYAPNVTLTDCTFSYCRAPSGGAIASSTVANSTDGTFEITNCEFKNNSTMSDETYTNGGAIYIAAGAYKIKDCSFTDNKADFGGAIYTVFKTEINNCNFQLNTAECDGGAVYTSGRLESNKCTMMYNTAENGGAFAGSGTLISQSDYIGENKASANGGAVYFSGAYTLNKGNVLNNKASKIGGGIFLYNTASGLTVNGAEIFGNTAKYCGSVYCKGYFEFINGGIGTATSEFPQIFTYGRVILGAGAYVKDDAFAISVTEKDGDKIYSRFELSDTPSYDVEFNAAYANEELDGDKNVIGFSNATRGGAVFYSGSSEALSKAVKRTRVVSRGPLSYVLDENGEASVRLLRMPIWAWIIIGTAVACAITAAVIFRKQIKSFFTKRKKRT